MKDGDPRVVAFAPTSAERRLFPLTTGAESMQTGMGDAASADAFQRALRLKMSGAISFGFAGALLRDLPCGTLLLPRAVRKSDGRRLETDRSWHGRVLAALLQWGLSPDVRDIAQTGQILDGGPAKSALARATLAVAADMESGTLGDQALAHGIPFLVLRVVLDELEDELPASLSRAVAADGNVAPAQLLGTLLRAPRTFGPLLQLALRRRVAAPRLQSAARQAAPELGQAGPVPGSQ